MLLASTYIQISNVGMGGIGKTTLATKLCWDDWTLYGYV